jgi:peroxiredoxin/mono/diheme cytochrome c family protein
MTQSDLVPADESFQSLAARRRVRRAAKLIGAIGLVVAGCVLAYHSLWSFRDEWASMTANGPQNQREIAAEIAENTLVRGVPLYEAHCQRCHGADGHGDGSALTDARQRPRDLASASWRAGTDRAAVRRVIEDGTADKAMHGLTGVLTTGELDSIADYVFSLEISALVKKTGLSPGGGAFAPPVKFRDADGITGTLEQHRGRIVVIAFWGTSCVACRKELPELALLAKKFENAGLVVLPVCVDETSAKTASEVAASIAPDLRVYVDHDGSSLKAYKIHHMPQTFIIDREGRMLAWSIGFANWSGKQVEELFRSFGVRQ